MQRGGLVCLASGEARKVGGIVFIPHAVGDFVAPGAPLALILGEARAVRDGRLRRAIRLGEDRTIEDDPAFAVRLIVDIAIRALSPAINDPTTAVLDPIEVLLLRLGSRKLETGHVTDETGRLRLVSSVPTWEDYLSLALTESHQYGRSSVQVQRRLGALLHDIEEALPTLRRGARPHAELTEGTGPSREDRRMGRGESRRRAGEAPTALEAISRVHANTMLRDPAMRSLAPALHSPT